MKRILSVILCVVFVLSFAACKKDENGRSEHSLLGDYERSDSVPEFDFTSGEVEVTEEYMTWAEGVASFSFSLLSEVAGDENVVISPLSVANVMAVLANGAEGTTLKELRQTLAGVDLDLINASLYYLNSRLSAFNTDSAYFKTADSLWFDDSFDVKASFLQAVANFYDAEVMRVAMADRAVVDKMNEWISDNTDGEITDAVGDIDPSSLAVAVNAVIMNDEWVTAYTEAQMSEGVFHGKEGDKTASYMTSKEHYISTAYAKGFVKGFKNLPLKFAAIMPTDDMSAEEFAEKLTVARWQALLDSQQATSFCVAKLPEFDMYTKSNLTDTLKALGIEKAFDADKADFSNLSNTGEPYISKVTQDAFIKVGPLGAKAGSATVALVAPGAAKPGEVEIPQLTFDKPFVFVIYDNESGVPVFMGIVNNTGK